MLIETAVPNDLEAVIELLADQHLPIDGVEDCANTMIVARQEVGVVGAAALELYADGALLRSVVVAPALRGQRLGHQLVESALDLARRRGVNTVFLLTTTAEQFFPRFGFVPISRDQVPASVRTSVEFQSACPASAVAMRADLKHA